METCSSCYFALLCSENCKRRHKKQRCIVQMIKRRLIITQDKMNKNGVTTKIFIEKKLNSPLGRLISLEIYCTNIV